MKTASYGMRLSRTACRNAEVIKVMKRTALKRYTPLRPRSMKNSRRPAESAYLKWVRSLACAVCGGANGKSEAAHTKVLGGGGIALKSDHKSAIPLCPWCHRLATDSYHASTPESRWAAYHDLDLQQLVADLNHQYEAMRAARKAALRRYVCDWAVVVGVLALIWLTLTLAGAL